MFLQELIIIVKNCVATKLIGYDSTTQSLYVIHRRQQMKFTKSVMGLNMKAVLINLIYGNLHHVSKKLMIPLIFKNNSVKNK